MGTAAETQAKFMGNSQQRGFCSILQVAENLWGISIAKRLKHSIRNTKGVDVYVN